MLCMVKQNLKYKEEDLRNLNDCFWLLYKVNRRNENEKQEIMATEKKPDKNILLKKEKAG